MHGNHGGGFQGGIASQVALAGQSADSPMFVTNPPPTWKARAAKGLSRLLMAFLVLSFAASMIDSKVCVASTILMILLCSSMNIQMSHFVKGGVCVVYRVSRVSWGCLDLTLSKWLSPAIKPLTMWLALRKPKMTLWK